MYQANRKSRNNRENNDFSQLSDRVDIERILYCPFMKPAFVRKRDCYGYAIESEIKPRCMGKSCGAYRMCNGGNQYE